MPNFLYSQLFVTPQLPKNVTLHGQTIIVTGANVGLGLEAAKHFARLHASKIILACRDTNKGKAAQQSIHEATNVAKDVLEVWQLDYANYESVKTFADRVNGLSRLDAVVENAGINTRKWNMLEDNESHITVNVVSTLLLAHLLLPKLRESAKATGQDGRLVIVGSEVYQWAKFDERHSETLFDALNSEKQANMGDRYNVSKLLLLLGVRELASRNPVSSISPVIISILTPGFCKTAIFRDGDFFERFLGLLGHVIGRTTEVGARTLVHAACPVHDREEHGRFLWDCQPVEVTGYAASTDGQAMQTKFWRELSARLEAIAPGVSTGV